MAAPTVRSVTVEDNVAEGAGLTLTVNIPVDTEEDDVCYLFIMSNSVSDKVFSESSTTWTKLKDVYISGSTNDVNLGLFRKVMGAVPDASVTVTTTGSQGLLAFLVVVEGADPEVPEDVAIIEASGAGASDPDCSSITPQTNETLIIAFAAATDLDPITNAPAGYSGLVDAQAFTDMNLMISFKELAVAAAEDPAPYADITSSAVQSWYALTVAVRPAPVVAPNVPGFSLLGVMRGAPLITPPAPSFLLLDEFRYGDLSHLGFIDLYTLYESNMIAPGDDQLDPPDAAFLNDLFAELADELGADRPICLDYEAWDIVTNPSSPTGISTTVVGYYETLITACKNHFNDVGLYGEIPERHTLYLIPPAGDPQIAIRRNNWFSRAAMMQPMWDLVDTLYPSFYYINPVHNNLTKFETWMDDNKAMCDQFAPGKPAYPFLWPKIHPSMDPDMPFVSGPYWRASLEKQRSVGFQGFTGWAHSADPPPDTLNPVPAFWNEMIAFAATV